jgi:FHS family L-fucose permease-like MFS transporter
MAKRVLAMVAVGAAMFILLVALNAGSALGLEQAWPMALLILLNMAAFVLAGPNASRALGLFATVAMVLLGIVVAGEGLIAVWAIIAIGLFNSILWSNIFTLAIDGLGEDTAQGSSLLVMMIVGGALVPPLQGAIIDLVGVQDGAMTGFHGSFVLPMICYAYLAWYGFKGSLQRTIRA